jgi:hypothetical protein
MLQLVLLVVLLLLSVLCVLLCTLFRNRQTDSEGAMTIQLLMVEEGLKQKCIFLQEDTFQGISSPFDKSSPTPSPMSPLQPQKLLVNHQNTDTMSNLIDLVES